MNDFISIASLVVAAALEDDTEAVRLLLRGLRPEQVGAVAEGSVLALAILIREHVPAPAVQAAIDGARQLATEAATEGDPS